MPGCTFGHWQLIFDQLIDRLGFEFFRVIRGLLAPLIGLILRHKVSTNLEGFRREITVIGFQPM